MATLREAETEAETYMGQVAKQACGNEPPSVLTCSWSETDTEQESSFGKMGCSSEKKAKGGRQGGKGTGIAVHKVYIMPEYESVLKPH